MVRLPIVLEGGEKAEYPNGLLLSYALSALAAYDREVDITYFDSGLRTVRINTVTYASTLHATSNIVATMFYLDVGSINQRVEKIEFTGSVFGSQTLRRVFEYTLSGIRYTISGFYYELV